MTTHLHITSWVLAFILFGLALMFKKQGKDKPAKILQMILRLDYLLILYSGGDLIAYYFQQSYMLGEVIVKGLAGIWVIAAMEMIAVKYNKGKPVMGIWVQFAIAVLIVLVLGLGRLPFGLHFMS